MVKYRYCTFGKYGDWRNTIFRTIPELWSAAGSISKTLIIKENEHLLVLRIGSENQLEYWDDNFLYGEEDSIPDWLK